MTIPKHPKNSLYICYKHQFSNTKTFPCIYITNVNSQTPKNSLYIYYKRQFSNTQKILCIYVTNANSQTIK